ncbi:MAG: dipeptidase, partial [Acidobacteria bacterium]|nr:dipeptidase [Acidobacteriota bacterium]
MNKVGMAVDVSHCGDRTTLDAFEISKKPALITHSNCRALAPGHPRCKTDEAIRKMAATGGVMGITSVRMFVKNDEPTTIEHFLDHFDHVKKLVGVEHLGVGSDIDLDGYDDMPAEENKRMFDLTEGLIRRKYTDSEVEMVLGGNLKRVLAQIWSAS